MAEANEGGGGNRVDEPGAAELEAIRPRRAGSEGERRAARHIQARLQELGREVEVEPTRVRPAFGLTHFVHAVAGVIASVVSVYAPLIGLVLAAMTTVSAFGDLTGAFHLVRALTPARASQNVISDEDNGKPGVIVLVAHYDAPRDATLTNGRLANLWPRAILISLGIITVCAAGRVLGLQATLFTVIQFIPTVVLIVLAPLLVDAAIAESDDGRAANAAGVATALQVAQETTLRHFDLMLLFTGASAHDGLGMRAWLSRHRKDLDPESTAVVVLDDPVRGDEPTYAQKEGAVVMSRMHPTLVELTPEEGTGYVSRELSDAYLARSAGLPTIRVSADSRWVGELLTNIDGEIGPSLA
jgi:hypothetical protein